MLKQITRLGGSLLIAGCGPKPGDEFVGHWASLQENDTRTVAIERKGDVFTASLTTRKRNLGGGYAVVLNEPDVQSGSAILKDGVLYAQWVGTLVPIMIDRATDHLVIGSVEFRRADSSMLCCKA